MERQIKKSPRSGYYYGLNGENLKGYSHHNSKARRFIQNFGGPEAISFGTLTVLLVIVQAFI